MQKANCGRAVRFGASRHSKNRTGSSKHFGASDSWVCGASFFGWYPRAASRLARSPRASARRPLEHERSRWNIGTVRFAVDTLGRTLFDEARVPPRTQEKSREVSVGSGALGSEKSDPDFHGRRPPRESLRDGSSEDGRAPRIQSSSDEARSTKSTGPWMGAASRFSPCAPPSNSGWKERRSQARPGQSGPVPLAPVAPTSHTLFTLRNSVGQLPRSDCSRLRACRSPGIGPAGVESTGHRLAGRRSEEPGPR